jgi:MFS family permease
MFGAIIMLPLYLQIIQGASATVAGLKLIPLMLGILAVTITSGRIISKTGKYRIFPILGTITMALGILLMTQLGTNTPFWQIALFSLIVGAGLGASMQTIVIAVQNAVEYKDLGIATSSNTFFRSLGGAFGTAIFGTILNQQVSSNLRSGFANLESNNPDQLANLDPSLIDSLQNNTEAIATLPPLVEVTVLESFAEAFQTVFWVALPVVLLGFVFALFLKEKPLQSSAEHANARSDAAGESIG